MSPTTRLGIKVTTQMSVIAVAVVLAVGLVASSSFIGSAAASRGRGQSENDCGLTGESGVATADGQALGQSTVQLAQDLKASGSNEGQGLVSTAASGGCRSNV